MGTPFSGKDIYVSFYKIYVIWMFGSMLMFCLGGINKVELLLSVIFIQLCLIFLVLCRIKSNIEKLTKSWEHQQETD